MKPLSAIFKHTAWITALVLVLTACSGNSGSGGTNTGSKPDSGQSPAATQAAAQGGDLSFALATSPDTLDPARSGLAVAIRVYRALFDNLVVQLPDSSIKPWLATEWTISDDGLDYTFKLRQDVKFHDGTPFNADAVKFSFERILDPATKSGNALALLTPLESVDVIDDYTVKLHLSKPSRAFLTNLSSASLSIVSPAAVAKYGDQFGQNPVGTGPFIFVKWDQNQQIVLKRNPDYKWAPETIENKGAPYLDTLTFKIVTEEATRIGSVQSGQVLAAETVPPQNVLALKNDSKTQLIQVNTSGLPYTLFINEKKEPWNDLKARQALQYGIDVATIVKTLYLGTYDQAWSALAPGMTGYDASLENALKPDPAKAGQLLDELGWVKGADGIREKDGKQLTLNYVDGSPNREKRNDIAVMIQQQLKAIGIKVNVNITKDTTTVVYTNGDYDIYGNSQVNVDPNALYQFYHTPAQGARPTIANYSNPETDALLEQAAVEKDDAKRADLYKQIQQKISADAVIIPIYVFPYTVAAAKSVQGLKFDLTGYPWFNDTSIQK
ncbi:ABC transporter substrate-binding protein [Paenibacillus protaetiae]|uniref:ABC transporter substrate-binding protein n=1 Tax=Paenibacillus protaetiae TaxID=2509456 RepID=A0A4P6ER33_9BACL|nr:ABC transporter substrate-binding protein [Paenibacillus protaetiae]QAY65322.1 ABC transporter substrate-binding protein [Paenibacillus protaetiae]